MRKKALLFLAGMLAFSILLDIGEGAGQPYTLTINEAGGGAGTVTSSPLGISCPADCSEAYGAGKRVTLKAKAGSDSYFVGWSGGGCSGTKTCKVTMDSDKTVAATFEEKVPDIVLSTHVLDFGALEEGQKATRTFKITNSGTADLIVSISGLEGTPFSVKKDSGIVVKPKKSCTVKVSCKYVPVVSEVANESRGDPEGGKSVKAKMKINHNVPNKPPEDVDVGLVPLVDAEFALKFVYQLLWNHESPAGHKMYDVTGTIPIYVLKRGSNVIKVTGYLDVTWEEKYITAGTAFCETKVEDTSGQITVEITGKAIWKGGKVDKLDLNLAEIEGLVVGLEKCFDENLVLISQEVVEEDFLPLETYNFGENLNKLELSLAPNGEGNKTAITTSGQPPQNGSYCVWLWQLTPVYY